MAERSSPAKLCFGCGGENPCGLGLQFRQEDGRAVAQFTPSVNFQGYPGIVHGGVLASVLDEAMGWATYWGGRWGMTARMTTRFRRPVPLGEPLTVSGWVVRDRGRILTVQSELRSAEGRVLAQADGTFVRVSEAQSEEMRRFYEVSAAR